MNNYTLLKNYGMSTELLNNVLARWDKTNWDGPGGYIASLDDKKFPILLHETWPGVPSPYCLGPRTGNQEPRAPNIRARTYVLPIALLRFNQRMIVPLGSQANGRGYCAQSMQLSRKGMDKMPQITGTAPQSLGLECWSHRFIDERFCLLTASLLTHQFQAEPCRCSRWVASIIKRIDLGYASNLMRVLISLATAWGSFLGRFNLVQKKLYRIRSSS